MKCKHNWLVLDKDYHCPIFGRKFVDVRVDFICSNCGETKFVMTKIDKGEDN